MDLVKSPTYSSEYVLFDKITEFIIPDDIPALNTFNGYIVFGIAAIDDVGNESDIICLPPLRLKSTPPKPPTDVFVEPPTNVTIEAYYDEN